MLPPRSVHQQAQPRQAKSRPAISQFESRPPPLFLPPPQSPTIGPAPNKDGGACLRQSRSSAHSHHTDPTRTTIKREKSPTSHMSSTSVSYPPSATHRIRTKTTPSRMLPNEQSTRASSFPFLPARLEHASNTGTIDENNMNTCILKKIPEQERPRGREEEELVHVIRSGRGGEDCKKWQLPTSTCSQPNKEHDSIAKVVESTTATATIPRGSSNNNRQNNSIPNNMQKKKNRKCRNVFLKFFFGTLQKFSTATCRSMRQNITRPKIATVTAFFSVVIAIVTAACAVTIAETLFRSAVSKFAENTVTGLVSANAAEIRSFLMNAVRNADGIQYSTRMDERMLPWDETRHLREEIELISAGDNNNVRRPQEGTQSLTTIREHLQAQSYAKEKSSEKSGTSNYYVYGDNGETTVSSKDSTTTTMIISSSSSSSNVHGDKNTTDKGGGGYNINNEKINVNANVSPQPPPQLSTSTTTATTNVKNKHQCDKTKPSNIRAAIENVAVSTTTSHSFTSINPTVLSRPESSSSWKTHHRPQQTAPPPAQRSSPTDQEHHAHGSSPTDQESASFSKKRHDFLTSESAGVFFAPRSLLPAYASSSPDSATSPSSTQAGAGAGGCFYIDSTANFLLNANYYQPYFPHNSLGVGGSGSGSSTEVLKGRRGLSTWRAHFAAQLAHAQRNSNFRYQSVAINFEDGASVATFSDHLRSDAAQSPSTDPSLPSRNPFDAITTLSTINSIHVPKNFDDSFADGCGSSNNSNSSNCALKVLDSYLNTPFPAPGQISNYSGYTESYSVSGVSGAFLDDINFPKSQVDPRIRDFYLDTPRGNYTKTWGNLALSFFFLKPTVSLYAPLWNSTTFLGFLSFTLPLVAIGEHLVRIRQIKTSNVFVISKGLMVAATTAAGVVDGTITTEIVPPNYQATSIEEMRRRCQAAATANASEWLKMCHKTIDDFGNNDLVYLARKFPHVIDASQLKKGTALEEHCSSPASATEPPTDTSSLPATLKEISAQGSKRTYQST